MTCPPRAAALAALAALACKPTPDSGDTGTAPVGCDTAQGCLLAEELSAGLLSVRAVAPDDVWIVGASPEPQDGTGPALLHYDGAAWERLDTSAWDGAELWWAWATQDEGVFVGSDGIILELDRATGALERADGPGEGTTLFGVWGASSDDLWAVGQSEGGEGPPALWRRQGGAWAAWEDPTLGAGAPGEVWFKVHGAAADDVWIVGTQGATLRWDGGALQRVASDADVDTSNAPLLTVDAGGEVPVAVGGAGNGLILEYDGGAWRDRSPDFQPGFNGVCSGAGQSWAVGQHGARAARVGGAWESDTDQGLQPLSREDWHGCAVASDGALWAVGGRIASRPLTHGMVAYQGPGAPPAPTLE